MSNEIVDKDMLERLSVLSNIVQVSSFFMNMEQISNDELMKALELQNKKYLEKILSNQEEILEKLNRLL